MNMQIEGYQLSPQQQTLFRLQQPEHPLTTQILWQVEGRLDRNRLRHAIEHVLLSHDILRTSYQRVRGMQLPVQIIAPDVSLRWRIEELNAQEEAQQQNIEQIARQQRERPFDLEHGPLLRVTLCILTPQRAQLLITIPRLSADSYSLHNLIKEAAIWYASCDEKMDTLAEVIQYNQFSAWQQGVLAEEQAQAGVLFQQQQDAYAQVLHIPGFENAGDSSKVPAEGCIRILPSALQHKLERYAQEHETQVKTIVLAGWQLLIWRLTQQAHILVRAQLDGRPYVDFEAGIGAYTKYIPLCSHFSTASRFANSVKKLDSLFQDAEELQEVLIEQHTDEKKGTSFLGFEAIEYHAPIQAGTLLFTVQQQRVEVDQFALKLVCNFSQDQHWSLELFGDEQHTNQAQCQRHLERLCTLLADAMERPEVPANQLQILPQAERTFLLEQSNATRREYPRQACLHQLFEEQVRRTPEQIALQYEDQTLTYQELNERANQLASYLRQQGMRPEMRIAIGLERSLNMIVSVVSILKAGAAYLPLDLTYPAERLRFMLEDGQVKLVLTEQRTETHLPQGDWRVIQLEQSAFTQEKYSSSNLEHISTPENLAYIIYTSGSTGQPKGVMIEHRSLVNYASTMCERLGSQIGWNFLSLSTLSADLGNTSIFCALLSGGCVHIGTQEMITDGNILAHYAEQNPIDVLKVVPSHLHALLMTGGAQILPRQALMLGGETFPQTLLNRLQVLNARCAIYNHYGPTETTIGVLLNRVSDKHGEAASTMQRDSTQVPGRTIPLGHPLANTQAYILDAHLHLVPQGVRGELYIGGMGLARGYSNKASWTSERFTPNPFSHSAGERLYRTGDLACCLPDGSIEYLGRVDNQVKIRGYRIELTEIEALLQRHPLVHACAVLVEGEESAQKRLIAYAVLAETAQDQEQSLRDYLSQLLPAYMLPTTFVLLKNLPLTTNGKIDRKALLALPRPSTKQVAYRSPQTQTQQQLATIWEDILEKSPIGLEGNFFEMGGHSLLVMRVLARVRKTFQVDLSVQSFFDAPTLAAQATAIEQAQHNVVVQRPSSPLVVIQSTGSRPPLCCIHPIGGDVVCYLNLARALGPEQPLIGLQAVGLEDEQAPLERIEEMAQTYLQMLKEHQFAGPYYLSGWSMGGVIAFEMARQLHRQGEQVAFLGLIDSYTSTFVNKDTPVVDDPNDVQAFLGDIISILGLSASLLPADLESLTQVDTDQQFHALLTTAQQAGAFPQELSLASIKKRLTVFRKNRQALRHYHPSPYPGRLNLYRAQEAPHDDTQDGARGWRALVNGEIVVHDLPGDHYALITSPSVEQLANAIKQHINVENVVITSAQHE